GQRGGDAGGGGESCIPITRSHSGRRAREGARHLPGADGKLREAGKRHRQDRRGEAWQLLLAGCVARSAVNSRSKTDCCRRARRSRQSARRAGYGDALCAPESRRDGAVIDPSPAWALGLALALELLLT